MLVAILILLVLQIVCCTDTDHIFDTKTVDVGDDVTLKCTRQISQEYLFWIRLVSGTFPEILGKTLSSDYGGVDVTRHITAKQEPGEYVLNINKAQLTDTAVYYCVKVTILNMSFLKGTFLRVKGPEPDVVAVTQEFSSDPLRPGESMTLQCSVLSESENRTCPDHSMYWFRAGSDESPHTLMYVDGNTSDQCEKSPEARSLQTCVYSFSKNVSSSDAGTYYCAVATCGQILFGNGTQVHIEETRVLSQTTDDLFLLLCAALALCLIVITLLVYAIMKKSCGCCKEKQGIFGLFYSTIHQENSWQSRKKKCRSQGTDRQR
ncbi:signal-regulatory protein beta-2-like [Anabas testudineus]|uniref:signal-regulatory protein beta-2-like n=1 Tax=Anabas testudineus TaxID=64144 RepID=UPI00143DE213|nr:signal-regulatory protein beta-2-like [Anabas testudineus]